LERATRGAPFRLEPEKEVRKKPASQLSVVSSQ
jgi:hypothetical protein